MKAALRIAISMVLLSVSADRGWSQESDNGELQLKERTFTHRSYRLPQNASDADRIEMILKSLEYQGQSPGDSVGFEVNAAYDFPQASSFAGRSSRGYNNYATVYRRASLAEFERICRQLHGREIKFIDQVVASTNLRLTSEPFVWNAAVIKDEIHALPEGRVPHVELEGTFPCRVDNVRQVFVVTTHFSMTRAQYDALKQGAPVMAASKTSAPPRRDLMLTVTGPGDAPVKGPERKVYKPGERPVAPKAPVDTPCPAGRTCATQEGGALTAEGLAYQRELRAHEAAVRAYEAREAAARAAVEEENRKVKAAYDEQIRLNRERQAAIDARRQAKIDADKATYAAQMRAHRAEVNRINREHEERMAEWRRRVAACQSGDRSMCATQE